MKHTKIIAGAPAIHRGVARRLFMRQAGALSLMAGAGAPLALNLLAAGSAAAQPAGDYRAVVCLFMFGGNDAFNMVLPTDTASWSAYTSARGSLALPRTALLPIRPLNTAGREFALHPVMGSLKALFDNKRLAIVGNVGPLVQPLTKEQYNNPNFDRPPRLFSHNDQQSVWQTMNPEGATQGWGGRMADAIFGTQTPTTFTAISAAGNAVWLSGERALQYQVGGNGPVRLGADIDDKVYGSGALATALRRLSGMSNGAHDFEADVADVSMRSVTAEGKLRQELLAASDPKFGTPVSGPYIAANDPLLQYTSTMGGALQFNALAHQLQVVARLIEAGKRGAIDAKRQVFFVSLGGFDTHSRQSSDHPELMAKVAHAMAYFDKTLINIDALNSVTTFTASDFGRSFTSNGDGTDHGWGAHHFVMGGAVKGGNVYGSFPILGKRLPGNGNDFDSPYQVRNGALLPTTSVDQFGAAIGRWFGVPRGEEGKVFPNLGKFGNDPLKDLGFMS